MQQVKDGQLSELTELFERYGTSLYNFFMKLTTDVESSEDLTQNVFYRMIRYRHSFDQDDGNFRSWMYQIARNLHADYCRQKQRMTEVVKDVKKIMLNPEQEQYTEQQFEKLELALAGLRPTDRELIILSRYEKLKYAEIAKIKNMSLASIKVQMHRAIKELRELYFKN